MNRMLSVAMLALLLCSAVFAQDEAAKREAAQLSARSWLALVDRGDYGQSWQESASFFQSKISKADWEKALQQVRTPLGAAGSRTLMGALYQTDVPNAPKMGSGACRGILSSRRSNSVGRLQLTVAGTRSTVS